MLFDNKIVFEIRNNWKAFNSYIFCLDFVFFEDALHEQMLRETNKCRCIGQQPEAKSGRRPHKPLVNRGFVILSV